MKIYKKSSKATQVEIDRAIQMFKKGMSARKIALSTNRSPATVNNWIFASGLRYELK